MTGVKAPAAVLGASVVVAHAKTPAHTATALGTQVAHKTLPFTGIALSAYLAIALAMVLAGLVLRAVGKSEA